MGDEDKAAVERAFAEAIARHKSPSECYTAAVDALHRRYPDAVRTAIASRAVTMLTAHVRFQELAKGNR
jgi:hypothetical protein